MISTTPKPRSFGGILIPLDMFRVSVLAAVTSELLVSKARNILDAKLVLTRHPASELVLTTIRGTVMGDDPATFWRENADIALAMSQVLPRQCFLFFRGGHGDDRREGFVIAQRGQMLAADDMTADRLPPGANEDAWPLTKLAQQMRLDVDELANGFVGGPSVELSLAQPQGDDEALLMTLMGQAPPQAPETPAQPPTNAPDVAADLQRREREQEQDNLARRERANRVISQVRYRTDELGVVVRVAADLSEPEILSKFVVTKVHGDLPEGLDRDLTDALQGKRIDIAIEVEFLSEVFVDNTPLSRPEFERRARPLTVAGQSVQVVDVLAPRVGHGRLLRHNNVNVFISRGENLPVPEDLLAEMLALPGA